jgi:flagellar basal body-associated protein FliL
MTTEKQKTGEFPSTLDPGYLMLAMYVLGVTVLVMFAWFGGSGAGLEGEQNRDKVVANEQMTERPDIQRNFLSDQV